MDPEKTPVPATDRSEDEALAGLRRKEEGADLDVEATSVRSDRTRHERNDLENQNGMGLQLSNTTGASRWSSEDMSLPQEILFVATVCLTQFCNRASPVDQLQPPKISLSLPSHLHGEWLMPPPLP